MSSLLYLLLNDILNNRNNGFMTPKWANIFFQMLTVSPFLEGRRGLRARWSSSSSSSSETALLLYSWLHFWQICHSDSLHCATVQLCAGEKAAGVFLSVPDTTGRTAVRRKQCAHPLHTVTAILLQVVCQVCGSSCDRSTEVRISSVRLWPELLSVAEMSNKMSFGSEPLGERPPVL